jgi:hypothetical protein
MEALVRSEFGLEWLGMGFDASKPAGWGEVRPMQVPVIALWLGHEQVETTHIYLHADMGIKERALAATAPAVATPGRFRPNDKLLAFLEAL